MSDRTSAKEQFGRNAEKYLHSQAHNRPDELEALVVAHSLQGSLVVDVGTGAGHVAYALAPFSKRVIAYDVAPEMLEIVRREAETRGLTNIEVQSGTAEELPFADASIDGIACRTAAHHFHDVAAFVGSSARSLTPGGWLFIQDTISPEMDNDAALLDQIERLRDPSHVWNLKPSEWIGLLVQHGFAVEFEELGKMQIDLQQWLDRMEVPSSDQAVTRELISSAPESLQKVIEPHTEAGRDWFCLPKITLVARKQAKS